MTCHGYECAPHEVDTLHAAGLCARCYGRKYYAEHCAELQAYQKAYQKAYKDDPAYQQAQKIYAATFKQKQK
jgi:hypothetical protein